MFGRYLDRAQRVILVAQQEARRLNYRYVSTEHLLLGLLREEGGMAAGALKNLGIDLEHVRSEIEKRLGRGTSPPTGELQFTPRGKKVIMELAVEEARALGHAYVGTEHLLLGLIREGECPAAQVLAQAGADTERVRVEVVKLLGASPKEAPDTQPGPAQPSQLILRAVAVVLDPQGRVLLVRRKARGAEWHLPSTFPAPLRGEFTRDAAGRAVREAAGLPVVCERLLWVVEGVQGSATDIRLYYLSRPAGPAADASDRFESAFVAQGQVPAGTQLPSGFWDVLTAGDQRHDPWQAERVDPPAQS